MVAALWPMAERLGLFPGARLDRLTVSDDERVLASARLVQVVGLAHAPVNARLVATDDTARACEPIHLVPLVEVADGVHRDELVDFYASIGMAPCGPEVSATERGRLGPTIVELCGGEPTAILAVMRAMRPFGLGAGTALANHEAIRCAVSAPERWSDGDSIDAPLELYETQVDPEWVDYNGHMTEAAYLTAAGWASDVLFRYIGDDEAYRAAGHSFYTVETHIHYLREVAVHEPIRFTTQMLGADAKRMHVLHLMYHGTNGTLLSTAEQMLVHVDMASGRSTPILPNVAAAVTAVALAHRHLPVPPQVGSVMQLPTPRS
jgi:acyl-CoA thioesterase FadM